VIHGKCPSGGFFGIKKTPSQLTGCFLLLVTFLEGEKNMLVGLLSDLLIVTRSLVGV
jgi:hypothetical protein